MSKDKTMTIKLVKSGIGRMEKHKLCIKGLGFKKLNQTVTILDTPSNRGMVNKIADMIEVQEG
ncbi:MAG: 50S ribosomal protein L30 [Gammaproteobacteria bacterium]|jgi:large subunit ribosomal protein L30|uniref:Large ribosomal subunit protein uL30 n=1 Tax=SAR86 cluster bacterium SAR86B TaxID=1123867 RepID=J5KMW5_9GAMM|nr:MAG: ribosomal protein L30 [SAR86 cluster bacterium SAR86B]NCW58537.1 50S ribosomal protein L30 [Pseudomonadota bacterium]NCX10379.1 50S ribosomal protein L30 [Pseudomonadota bacterium]NCX24471.1 50S ribosomal protein L30 [Pseudomonadota bacterium]NCX29955.1 50S ribosomal protein L30 [Pseudomonadota bacterium]|tara:strand:+ start:755 stop:943 length:189 start_codon:yes stop_codon:yes gene_type:complete